MKLKIYIFKLFNLLNLLKKMDEISNNNLCLLFIFPNEKKDFDKFGINYQFKNMNSYIVLIY